MPLDGHSYLVAQGWSGTGTGLRTGAISRPLAIPQKKNLAGLGKDRDEAFPFWDHLFTAAASAIKIKATDSDEDSDAGDVDQTTPAAPLLKRTSTGIISNRRPVVGTPASSGTSTPDAASASGSATPRLSLMAIAKRQAAQRGLYSRFFRGPVLGPHDVDGEMVMSEIKADGAVMEVAELVASGLGKGKGKAVDEGSGDEKTDEGKKEKKKRKVGEVGSKGGEEKERKRRKKDLKEAEKRERRERKREKKAREAAAAADGPDDGARKEKKEKKFRNDIDEEMREARKRRKLERRNEQAPASVDATSSSSFDTEDTPRKRKKHTGEEPAPVQDTPKESKKRRKREKHESS